MSLKNPLIPSGIEPATFQFVAQHLNHCATVVPHTLIYLPTNFRTLFFFGGGGGGCGDTNFVVCETLRMCEVMFR